MANRQSRDPGTFRSVQSVARVGGVPDFAVDTGDAARALANVAGSMSGRLRALADKAAIREAEQAGLSAAQRGSVSYLQARSVEQDAPTAKKGRPSRAQVNAPSEIRNTIVQAAKKYGLGPNALLKVAQLESSFNPQAKNPNSSAGGLFQFIDGTAKDYGLKNRYDPVEAADAGARLMRDNRNHLVKVLGREPTAGELYLAHQQGRGGAAKLLGNPNAKASDLVGSDAVRLNGGKAGMLAKDFAALWLRKAGDEPGSVRHGLPSLTTEPLALRRDGTLHGDAFDAAAIRAYSWRVSEGLSTDLANAYQDFGDDPGGFANRMSEIRETYLKDPNLADPEVREAFEKSFAQQSRGYRLKVATNQEGQLRQEELAATQGAISARERDIERQAHALGANDDGDAILHQQLQQSHSMVDAAVEAGTLTPLQGQRKKESLSLSAVRGRAQGVFDALDTPAKKEQFALSLLEDWQSGEGPIAQLDHGSVKALSQSLYRDARALANKQDAETKLKKTRIKSLINDDIASIEKTGKSVDFEAAGIPPETLVTALTPEEYQSWQEGKDIAGRIYDAVADLDTLSAEEIEQRLEALEPEAGSEGFRDQEAILTAAERKARSVLKLRSLDPARAVEESFDEIGELADMTDPEDPQTIIDLVGARLRAQETLDIPELARQPLTVAEATNLARALKAGDDASQVAAMQDLVEQAQMAYGDYADEVLRQVLQVHGVDRELAKAGAQMFKKISKNERPNEQDFRKADLGRELGASDASFGAAPDPATTPVPPYQAIQLLLDQPDLAPSFDKKYGQGAAERVLSGRRNDPYRRRVEGGTEFVDDTGEGFIPDGK
ncbi:transglycosylase SLT domain-containing protein [Roseibium sp. TrichSKD4]|uniref:transglycosylase SLT domain-containing protein n=1 Tax=Roseibium sp. TrichSKD4 TaxID=744980 RepID=UPI00068234CA